MKSGENERGKTEPPSAAEVEHAERQPGPKGHPRQRGAPSPPDSETGTGDLPPGDNSAPSPGRRD